jgi:hypothetical protein
MDDLTNRLRQSVVAKLVHLGFDESSVRVTLKNGEYTLEASGTIFPNSEPPPGYIPSSREMNLRISWTEEFAEDYDMWEKWLEHKISQELDRACGGRMGLDSGKGRMTF